VRDFQDSDTDGMTAIMRGMAIIGVVKKKKSGRGCVSAWESMQYIHAIQQESIDAIYQSVTSTKPASPERELSGPDTLQCATGHLVDRKAPISQPLSKLGMSAVPRLYHEPWLMRPTRLTSPWMEEMWVAFLRTGGDVNVDE
jgi:hypothetical protein